MNETKRRLLGTSRNRPLYFAGRRDELSKLERHKRYVQETRDPAGGLMLIDGVQGIGKTQLMNEFAERMGRDSAVRVVRVPTPDLDDQLALFIKMVRALGGSEGRARRMAGVGGGLIESRIAGRGVARARAMQVLPPMNEMLERSRESALWRKGLLLLLVDEIQNMTPSQGVTLRMLHEGAYGCPVMVLCAGLQHATQQLARNAGISRYAGRLRLAPLSRNETIDAFVGGMEAVGFGISEEQAAVLATASMGFPQHIHGYLEGAIAAMERHGSLASGEAMAEAKAHGDLARVEYYEGRHGSCIEGASPRGRPNGRMCGQIALPR